MYWHSGWYTKAGYTFNGEYSDIASMLVLNGPQGMGKSTFYALLGRKWFSDSLSIADMRDKTAAEKLQGYWILEIAEMNGIKKVDVETEARSNEGECHRAQARH